MTGSDARRVYPWGGLAPMDRWLAALRAVALLGAAAWLMVHLRDHPMDPEAHHHLVRLFAAFSAYSLLIYVANWLRPGRLRLLYRIAMFLDLAFIFHLVRITGGMASDFYLALYLLIALHAFYFGLATGGGVALLASALYLLVDPWPPPIHLNDLALRLGFFLLVGLSMGGLSERERWERGLVEQLNRELEAQDQHLRETQEQLIRSDRLATVGELAAGLAHDLRNPLAGISGALHVLTDQLPRDGPQRPVLAEVQSEIARMDKTLHDLLQHSRPPAPQYLPLNVNGIVENSLWLLPRTPGAGIEIVKHLDPDLPTLRLDPNLFNQALLNVLVNARQAMPNGGRLTVTTRLHPAPIGNGRVVEVAVADTGAGIPPEHVSKIFHPFFTTKAQGTGLGLAIANRIVDQHGGRISVESEPGKGATFRIILPVQEESTGHGQEEHLAPDRPRAWVTSS